jgi:hypothetical protein
VTRTIRRLLLVEGGGFVAAALIHSGYLLPGYEHEKARIAESVIALVLLAGLVSTWVRPALTRTSGLLAQAFALLGTLVGAFTMAIGVGPRTTLDVVFHAAMLGLLAWGLGVTARKR